MSRQRKQGEESQILEDLFNEAESVVELVNNQDRERKSHIIGIKALEDIPCAVAYSAKGLYYKEKATDSQDMVEKAYNAYLKAATLVPKDDESYARYLNAALDIMLTHGAPVKLLLKMADDVREGMRKMYPVWGSGPDNGESMKCNLVRVNTVKGLRARGVVKDEDRYCWSDDSM
ncbi:hypothetical protein MPER_04873 [Moniliophthora perniciosa FA553]|nr:hypothetical protein MPER_04873 [Moniliophthora perniciosa FA553]